MCSQSARHRGGILTLIASVSPPFIVKVTFAMINIHHFFQIDPSSFTASAQLTKKVKLESEFVLRHLLNSFV